MTRRAGYQGMMGISVGGGGGRGDLKMGICDGMCVGGGGGGQVAAKEST